MSSSSTTRGSPTGSNDADSPTTSPSSAHPQDSESSTDDPPDVVQLLIAKRSVTCEADCPCTTMSFSTLKAAIGETAHRLLMSGLGDAAKHWALRVGEDVYELRQRDGVNRCQRLDFDSVKELYDARSIYGTTRLSSREVKKRGKCPCSTKITQCSG